MKKEKKEVKHYNLKRKVNMQQLTQLIDAGNSVTAIAPKMNLCIPSVYKYSLLAGQECYDQLRKNGKSKKYFTRINKKGTI